MKQRYLQWVLKYLPKRTISRWMGKLARQPWSRRLIPIYIRYFRVDLTPVKKPVHEFENLLAFFIRELRPDMRPVAREDHLIISPVDGTISQVGEITEGKLFQAKGITYSLEELLGHQKKYVESFLD
ncbi:phosphatidylserine decarboxylase, partial [Thermoactinomyces sp. Gus2-1]|uniref:phosphatidylserine decarboxylase n=1 Tax=Thermoactinomyces sp. Gus2-1 TaxID=1535750 RepID=UPI0005008BFD